MINACECRTTRKGCPAPQDLCLFGRSVRLPTICHLGKQKKTSGLGFRREYNEFGNAIAPIRSSNLPRRRPLYGASWGECRSQAHLINSKACRTVVVRKTSSCQPVTKCTENERLPAGHQVAGTHGLLPRNFPVAFNVWFKIGSSESKREEFGLGVGVGVGLAGL